MTRIFSEKISTRATRHPELEAAVKLAGEIRSSGVAVTLVVHEPKRLGRGIELAMLAEELKASDVALEFLAGELKGSHDPSGIVFTVLAAMSGMEREYIRDRTLEGHESARKRGKTIGGAGVTDEDMLSMALHLRDQEMSLRDIAKRLVITNSPAWRALRGELTRGPAVPPGCLYRSSSATMAAWSEAWSPGPVTVSNGVPNSKIPRRSTFIRLRGKIP
ncbi:recombinase family protein [Streptomyces chattanoogensis]|uniref:recombinase family protein n=1 Tax=Streptomyces chattanoogensis TaxID=66876 RepID=UPI0036A0E66A